MSRTFTFTSESVTEGHPDKVCDFIADSVLDAHLAQDPDSRVACEVLCKDEHVILGGEISSTAVVDLDETVRTAIQEVGYTDPGARFRADAVRIQQLISLQSGHIAQGVNRGDDLGAGDQGLMFGFATGETPDFMPLPIWLAHRVTRALAHARKTGETPWMRPDGKAQVSVRYWDGKPVDVTDVVVSTQHAAGTDQECIRAFVRERLLPEALGDWWTADIRTFVNPTGEFAIGGPEGDCGVTGRKIIADTYGGFARHGGGAFSGKDPTKVDRSAAYFARYVARQIVQHGIATCAEIQVAYAIGVAAPVSILVDTRGTGDDEAAEDFVGRFDFRPAAIIERLGLRRPIYRGTTNYGHFGKHGLPWENSDSTSSRRPSAFEADDSFDLASLNRRHVLGYDKWYRMFAGAASTLRAIDDGILYIDIHVSDRMRLPLPRLVERMVRTWPWISELKQARGYMAHVYFMGQPEDLVFFRQPRCATGPDVGVTEGATRIPLGFHGVLIACYKGKYGKQAANAPVAEDRPPERKESD